MEIATIAGTKIDLLTLALGGIGGALPDVLRVIDGRHGGLPAYLGSPYFWVSFVILILLGAGAAVGVTVGQMVGDNSLLSKLAVGYSAPSLISKLLSEKARTRSLTGGRGLRGWWAD